MSGFDLVPVAGGDPIHLPPGETVLGRGPLLGISDKRVSRLHGLLENLDGQLRLKPTHLNPCFVQSSLSDDPRPLQRDSWHPLHHGDLFSLLPGQFVFRVVAVGGGGDGTPRNSQMFEEEEELPVSPKPDVEPRPPVEHDHRETSAVMNQDEAGGSETPSKKVEVKHLSERRRRVLPAWMMAAVAAAHSSSSSPKVQSAGKRRKAAAAATTSTKQAAARPVKTSSPEEAELSEEERPVKRRRKIQDEEEEEADVPSATVQPRSESIRPEVSDESDNFTIEEEKEEKDVNKQKPPTPAVSRSESDATTLRNGRQMTESVGSNGGSASGPAPPRARLRTPCPYGKDCYRKNPLHFQESSHPGDSDYEEEEEEAEEADRPECPYGTDCYRKNPLHRKEFKHTEKPASTRRSVQKKAPADDEDEDEDEDSGDDDSFINDDSEDAGDDSDYLPPDSDDSGKEDVKRLQREAKAFVKRGK